MRRLLLLLAMILWFSLQAKAQNTATLTAATASCTFTSAGCLVTSISQTYGGATFTVTANAGGNTIQFEASGDGATTWVPLNVFPSNSTTAATFTTSTGTWQVNVAAYTHIRMRMSTQAGGNTTVQINLSNVSARPGGSGGGGDGAISSANILGWTRLGAVLGTPFTNSGTSNPPAVTPSSAQGYGQQEPSCWIQTSPQLLNSGYTQVVACLFTRNGNNIAYAEAPTPQGPFTVQSGNAIANAGCASDVLSVSGQLVVFACASRLDIHRYHSATHGISWVDDGAVVTHVAATWLNAVANSATKIVNNVCYLWVEGDATGQTLAQGLWTGNSTCDAGSFTAQAGNPQIPTSEINGGGPFVYYDGANFWQWEHAGATVANAYPTWVYFTELNPNGAGTIPPHTHTVIVTPKAADEGYNNALAAGVNAQVADPFLLEWPYAQGDARNTTYMYYSSCSGNCFSSGTQEFTLKVASIPLPMTSIIKMTQTDQGVNANYLGYLFVDGISSNTQLPVPTMFDNGNGENGSAMGTDWTAVYGNAQAQIVSNQFEPFSTGSRPLNARVQPNADQFSSVQLIAGAATSTVGVVVRGNPLASNYYECVTTNALGVSQTLTLRKFVGQGPTTIASATATPRVNDWLVATAQGATIGCTLYDPQGNTTISGSDTALGSGLPGMALIDATPSNAILANWSGGSLYGDGAMATQNTQIWTVPQIFEQAVLQPYTVGNLPSASTVKAGTTVVVTDATTFTVGTCTGGGSDTMLAVSNGTTWSCH